MTYATGAAELVRVQRWVLTITCDYCTLSNGLAPCAAATQCYYTYPTCKNQANYTKGSRDYVYQHGGPLLNVGTPTGVALPYLLPSFGLIPTKIAPSDFRTERGELKVKLVDDLAHPVANPDKIGYTALDTGRYWPNWIKRNPNYRGVSATFWRNLFKVGDASTFQVFGTPNCGKGEPNQIITVGHASPVCAFRQVEIFGGDS